MFRRRNLVTVAGPIPGTVRRSLSKEDHTKRAGAGVGTDDGAQFGNIDLCRTKMVLYCFLNGSRIVGRLGMDDRTDDGGVFGRKRADALKQARPSFGFAPRFF